jgi:maleate isomerase
VAVIVPSVNVCAEPELAAMAPPGVSVHTTRLRLATSRQGDVRGMADASLGAANLLADLGPDFLVFNCTAAAALAQPGLAERLADAAGCPTTTTADAISDALTALGASRLVLISPYPRELADPEEEFFATRGFEVCAHEALDIGAVREWPEVAPSVWRDVALEAYAREGGDAVVLSCTNIRVVEIADALEREIGVPVVTSNQAALWSALAGLGVDDPVQGYGALLSRPVRSAATRQAGS